MDAWGAAALATEWLVGLIAMGALGLLMILAIFASLWCVNWLWEAKTWVRRFTAVVVVVGSVWAVLFVAALMGTR